MTKLAHSLALVCLVCITISSSLPVCLSLRPFPADKDAVVAVAVDSTMDAVNAPTDSASDSIGDAAVTSSSFSEVDETQETDSSLATEEEDLIYTPCYATVAEAQIEGRSDATNADDLPLVEVDCRRILAGRDYTDPSSNINKRKCNGSC